MKAKALLPTEVLLQVFRHVPCIGIFHLVRVCKAFCGVALLSLESREILKIAAAPDRNPVEVLPLKPALDAELDSILLEKIDIMH